MMVIMSVLLDIQDLKVWFRNAFGSTVQALDGIQLTIHEGMTFGLVGESGCGKSVTARSIMRLQDQSTVQNGAIYFVDPRHANNQYIDLLSLDENTMRQFRGKLISMIFQEPNAALNPIMTVGDQIAECFLIHQKMDMQHTLLHNWKTYQGIKKWLFYAPNQLVSLYHTYDSYILVKILRILLGFKWLDRLLYQEAINRATSLLTELGISDAVRVIQQYPHELSGGMKQRICIAMAIACNPVLLIADEATSNLDVTIQSQILKLFKDLKKIANVTILFITHDLGVVAETCTHASVMYAGQICETAPVNVLFEAPYHPYTKALIHAVPRYNQDKPLESIPGSVPDLQNPPSGCRFHPRCPKSDHKCVQEKPILRSINYMHFVACWRANEEADHE